MSRFQALHDFVECIDEATNHAICSNCSRTFRQDEELALQEVLLTPPSNEPSLVSWVGNDDPQNPFNMSPQRKWGIVFATGAMTFCVSFASSVFSTTVFVTAAEFDVDAEIMLLGVSLYVLGFAFGPLIFGPLSEVYGRTIPLWAGMGGFILFQIPVATATNLTTIFICRFIGGVFGSAPLAILGGMYADFFGARERGLAGVVFASATFMGPIIGPIVGSYITASHLGWRGTIWATFILTVIFTASACATTPETFEPILLQRRANRLRAETKNWALHAKADETPLTLSLLTESYLQKPFQMITLEPILLIITIYMSVVYGILYLTFEAYPFSFEIQRQWSPQHASLPFLALLLGVLLACVFLVLFGATWHSKRLVQTGKLNPEDRLPPMILGGLLLPAGLFWFGWTSNPATSAVGQILSGVFIGMGVVLIFMSGVVYIVDVYLIHANSAIAINTFVRSLVAAVFPMIAKYIFQALGMAWAISLMGFVCLALVPFPVLFFLYGKRIRQLSRFNMEMESEIS